jgi:hypothetical protein
MAANCPHSARKAFEPATCLSRAVDSVVTNSSSPPGWRGRHWNALEYPGRVFATGLTGGLRPINTAYLPTVDSVVENIDSHLQQIESNSSNFQKAKSSVSERICSLYQIK